MRKFTLLLLFVFSFSMLTMSQKKMFVHKSDGTTVEFLLSEVDSIEIEKPLDANGLEYVDLGLPSGTLWATCNVGAISPEGYGYYFGWGERVPKDDYYWYSYTWILYGHYNELGINKYTIPDGWLEGIWYENGNFVGDNKRSLELIDDAGHRYWGGDWRMPTMEERDELHYHCKSYWETLNGVNGVRFVGPNGNSIFLPAAGNYSRDEVQYKGEEGHYWTKTLSNGNTTNALGFAFDSSSTELVSYTARYLGASIRPVLRRN